MSQVQEGRLAHRGCILVSVLTLAAAGGWSAFAYSALASKEAEKRLQGKVAILHDYQVRFLSERERAEAASLEIAQLRAQLSSGQEEARRLAERNSQIETELTAVQDQLRGARRIQYAQSEDARTALIHVTPRPTKRDVAAAQEVLTELRYGALKADGVAGPDTRRAIEEYQRATGLPVTGELHAQTLQALLHAGRVMAAQQEQVQETF